MNDTRQIISAYRRRIRDRIAAWDTCEQRGNFLYVTTWGDMEHERDVIWYYEGRGWECIHTRVGFGGCGEMMFFHPNPPREI